ncbi:hypothetical protein PZB75_30965 (plasmid) [Streptomyces sp. AM 4-1-1]|uniref:hypothetical protein n=1 Tax=Streptomyces sp. AM 4-1-1 TaxID=3028710 RepID=UPI0023BA28FF|nr:hypothetical protein [Streptomyces sp. AM 4-1-1]WEH37826.1 hypothetical protein PZB75_30965 [Streptomyces sp. AM 4-1-1]
MNPAPASELATAVRTALTPFVTDPTAGTLCDLSRAMSKMTAYANSGRSHQVPGPWPESYFACDHAHEHIQKLNHTFATSTAPAPLDVRTVKYAVLAAIALFDDAVRSDTPNPSAEHEFSVFAIARAAAHLLGSGWRAEPGLHNTTGLIQHSIGEDYLLTVGDVGDMRPELYVESDDNRHILWDTAGEELPALAQRVADTIRDPALA